MLKVVSFVLSVLFLLAGTVGCFMLAGNRPAGLVYFVPSLAMGLILTGCSLASLVTLTRSFPEISASGLTEHFSDSVAATIVSLIYTVVLAELVLRPLKHRLVAAQ